MLERLNKNPCGGVSGKLGDLLCAPARGVFLGKKVTFKRYDADGDAEPIVSVAKSWINTVKGKRGEGSARRALAAVGIVVTALPVGLLAVAGMGFKKLSIHLSLDARNYDTALKAVEKRETVLNWLSNNPTFTSQTASFIDPKKPDESGEPRKIRQPSPLEKRSIANLQQAANNEAIRLNAPRRKKEAELIDCNRKINIFNIYDLSH